MKLRASNTHSWGAISAQNLLRKITAADKASGILTTFRDHLTRKKGAKTAGTKKDSLDVMIMEEIEKNPELNKLLGSQSVGEFAVQMEGVGNAVPGLFKREKNWKNEHGAFTLAITKLCQSWLEKGFLFIETLPEVDLNKQQDASVANSAYNTADVLNNNNKWNNYS